MKTFLIKNATLLTDNQSLPNTSILIKNGHIAALNQAPYPADIPVVDAHAAYLCPGLIDTHIHGFGGYGPETQQAQDLLSLSDELAKQGVTSFCPTLYSASAEQITSQLRALAPVIGQEKGAKIIGFHLEGPFISPDKLGVMKAEDVLLPDVKLLEQWYQAAHGKIAALTLAPELPHLEPLLHFCAEHHIRVQAGHTNATYSQMMQGAQNGITHVTHLFNAMSPFTHRAPNAAGAALTEDVFSCEIIADGIHVHPAVVAFLRKAKSAQHIVLVTDALRPTGQAKGPFIANGEEVILENGAWYRKSDHTLAGSALTMLQGVRNLVAWGYPLARAVQCATANPARVLGLQSGRLEPGAPADFILLSPDLDLQSVYINGEKI